MFIPFVGEGFDAFSVVQEDSRGAGDGPNQSQGAAVFFKGCLSGCETIFWKGDEKFVVAPVVQEHVLRLKTRVPSFEASKSRGFRELVTKDSKADVVQFLKLI